MKYVVSNNFYDRFDSMKLCKIGDVHEPPNEDRALQLLQLGHIKLVEEEPEIDERLIKLEGGYYQLPDGSKVKGIKKAHEALKAIDAAGGGNSEPGKT